MNDVREFWLENQSGEFWYFTDEESNSFLEMPQGLGFQYEFGGYRLGNAQTVNYIESSMLDIMGNLLFYKETRSGIYQEYFDFLKFIGKNMLLKLHYRTPNSFESYYRYCFIRQLDKGEINNDSLILNCPIVIAPQTYWRNDINNSIVIDNSLENDGKVYQLKRPYHYSTSKLSNIKIINRGNIETSIKITIDGRTINPTFNIYDEFEEKYGTIRFLGEFDKVIVDSDDLNENIVLEKNGAILTSPYAYQDLSVGTPNKTYVTFIKIKSGQSTLRFSNDAIFNGVVTIEWSDEYVSV